MKYTPDYPERFASIGEARAWMAQFFNWYNHEHRHSGIGLHTPASVHFGTSEQINEQRARTLSAAYAARPERFVSGAPEPPTPPEAVWINTPSEHPTTDEETLTNPPKELTRQPLAKAVKPRRSWCGVTMRSLRRIWCRS